MRDGPGSREGGPGGCVRLRERAGSVARMRERGRTRRGGSAARGSFALAVLCGTLLTGCGGGQDYTAQGMEFVKNLDYQSALASFDEALAQGENSKLACRGKGLAYMGMTDYDNATASFLEALHASSGLVEDVDYDINFYLAAAYSKEGRPGDAKAVYDAILALRPQDEDALFLRGNAYMGLDDYESAKADFDRVVELNGKDFDRLIQIYQVLDHYGYREVGETYLNAAMASYESQMSAYDKGRMYYHLGQYQQAYLALEEAKNEGGAEAYLYLGMSYEATGDYNYASSVYNNYLTQDTSDARIYNQLGLCEMKKGQYSQALSAFQSGMQIEGNDMMQALQFNEIVSYEYLGDFDRAAVLMENYLATYPDDDEARREYSFLQTR